VEARKKVLYIFFFVNKWFVENFLYYLVFIIAFKHCWGPPLPTIYLYFIGRLTESGVRPNRAQVLTTTWVASAQSYHRLKTTQVIPAQSSYTARSGVDDAIQVNKSDLTLECCIWFCSIP
jgi:hypothetical protein